jgi:hypothetical protein
VASAALDAFRELGVPIPPLDQRLLQETVPESEWEPSDYGSD